MSKPYNIFISWSGPRSRHVAEALKDWLPTLLQSAKPWMSESDIEKGTRGLEEIGKALAGIKIGISCLTPENLSSPWILYEAGALAKALDDKSRLCTYLLSGLRPQDVAPPLGMFQATKAEKDDTRKLLTSINVNVGEEPVQEQILNTLFEKLWPDLDAKIKAMPAAEMKVQAKRPVEDMVSEIMDILRTQAQSEIPRIAWTGERFDIVGGSEAAQLVAVKSRTPSISAELVSKGCPICGNKELLRGSWRALCPACRTAFTIVHEKVTKRES
jgi:hypothetical protein